VQRRRRRRRRGCVGVDKVSFRCSPLYAIKTVPDYLLISSEMRKRGTKMTAGMFLLSEIIYPFYFVVVGVMSRLPGAGRFSGR